MLHDKIKMRGSSNSVKKWYTVSLKKKHPKKKKIQDFGRLVWTTIVYYLVLSQHLYLLQPCTNFLQYWINLDSLHPLLNLPQSIYIVLLCLLNTFSIVCCFTNSFYVKTYLAIKAILILINNQFTSSRITHPNCNAMKINESFIFNWGYVFLSQYILNITYRVLI